MTRYERSVRSSLSCLGCPTACARGLRTCSGSPTGDVLPKTPGGTTATLAVTDRTKDPDGAWIDGHTSYYELTVWGTPADNFADTARKGARLVAAGELIVEEYTDQAGQTRTTTRITATHLGLSTRFAPRADARPSRKAVTAAT